MNNNKRIIIACALIVGAVSLTRGANEKESIRQDIERSPEKHVVEFSWCECESRTNLNLQYTYWCPSCLVITVNGKLCREGETINGFKITSITEETIVFLCPEGHVLELERPAERDSRNLRDRPSPKPRPKADVKIIRHSPDAEVEIIQQSVEQPLNLTANYWNPMNTGVTIGGQNYSVGDTVNGFTIIENKIWFTDPMGDTAVTPFYDPSYYRKSNQASEVESDGWNDPETH